MPPVVPTRETGNHLLDRLPAGEFDALGPDLQRVGLALKQVVYPSEAEVGHVHFPSTALVSLLTVLEEDDPIEAGTVGREGFSGVAAVLGVRESPHRVICQLGGECLRLPIGPFLEAMERGPVLSRLVRGYIAYSLRRSDQRGACNALHVVEQRAARWLLVAHDQAGRDEFPMTQEFLAYMLGVRRQSVTAVAGTLQNAGMIEYRRGVIVVRDRAGLERAACECYATIRSYYARALA